jgi:uncharacterized membrane protein YeaQ/YmgE (transglycosylase-associated protein family)
MLARKAASGVGCWIALAIELALSRLQRLEETMGILTWIILGLIAGVIAKLIMPGDDPGGFIITILLGIAGALAGGFIASALDLGGVSGLNIWSIIIAILGAILLLWIYRLVMARRARST